MLRFFAYSAYKSALKVVFFLFGAAATASGPTLLAQVMNSEVELFDLPQTRWPGFGDLVIDKSNTPWVMANNSVYFFDGKAFREPVSGNMKSGQYLTRFYGDSNRGAYATQPSTKEHEGQLYQINSGESKLVTTFYYDTATDRPGIYISKDGRLFNWGQRFLAVYKEGAWERIEAKFGGRPGLYRPVISDFGSDVFFYVPANNRLFKVDSKSELSAIEPPMWLKERMSGRIENSNRSPVFACSWAGSRILVIDSDPMKMFAFDVRTQKQVEINLSQVELAKKVSLQNGFELKDGSVWLLGRVHRKRGYVYFNLTPDGKFTKVTAIQALPWSNTRHMQLPKSILEMSDDSIVFGLPQDGIAIHHSEQLSRWDWRQGFAEGVSHLQEGANGELWMPFDKRGSQMARVRVRHAPPPDVSIAEDWEEIALPLRGRVWTLRPGQIAMFRSDHPGQLSRWQNDEWSHQKMPFDTSRVFRSIVDDRGHLLIALGSHQKGYFDIGESSIERFKSMRELLVHAVEAGVKKFHAGPGFGGIVLTDEGKLWLGYHNHSRIEMYDGTEWSPFSFRDDVYYILESSEYGVLFRTQGGKYFRYLTGQFEEVEPAPKMSRAFMLGARKVQPFEKSLVTQQPNAYYPVIRTGSEWQLFFDVNAFQKAFKDPVTWPSSGDASVKVPRHFDRLVESPTGGAWIFVSQGAGAPSRLIEKQLRQVDFSKTPLAHKNIRDVKETPNGDLWFLTYYGQQTRLFRHRQSQLSLQFDTTPKSCGRELTVQVTAKPARFSEGLELLATLDGELQTQATRRSGTHRFRFPKSGEYRCAVSGIRLGGVVQNTDEFLVKASVSLPDTLWQGTSKEVTLQTFEWQPSVSAKQTSADVTTQIAWRRDEGAWAMLSPDKVILMVGCEPGSYRFEFRAEEDEFWQDDSPVVVSVKYEPDYRVIMANYCELLLSNDPAIRKKASERLIQIGPKIKPQLVQKLEEASNASKLMPQLRKIHFQMDQLHRNPKPLK